MTFDCKLSLIRHRVLDSLKRERNVIRTVESASGICTEVVGSLALHTNCNKEMYGPDGGDSIQSSL